MIYYTFSWQPALPGYICQSVESVSFNCQRTTILYRINNYAGMEALFLVKVKPVPIIQMYAPKRAMGSKKVAG
jgi:hypothetical protein